MGGDRWIVKISWLGKLVLAFWWVELDFFCLECNQVSSSEFSDVYEFDVTLGRLYIEAQHMFLRCWRLCMVCLALELVGSWVVLGFSVDMGAFG